MRQQKRWPEGGRAFCNDHSSWLGRSRTARPRRPSAFTRLLRASLRWREPAGEESREERRQPGGAVPQRHRAKRKTTPQPQNDAAQICCCCCRSDESRGTKTTARRAQERRGHGACDDQNNAPILTPSLFRRPRSRTKARATKSQRFAQRTKLSASPQAASSASARDGTGELRASAGSQALA